MDEFDMMQEEVLFPTVQDEWEQDMYSDYRSYEFDEDEDEWEDEDED